MIIVIYSIYSRLTSKANKLIENTISRGTTLVSLISYFFKITPSSKDNIPRG